MDDHGDTTVSPVPELRLAIRDIANGNGTCTVHTRSGAALHGKPHPDLSKLALLHLKTQETVHGVRKDGRPLIRKGWIVVDWNEIVAIEGRPPDEK